MSPVGIQVRCGYVHHRWAGPNGQKSKHAPQVGNATPWPVHASVPVPA